MADEDPHHDSAGSHIRVVGFELDRFVTVWFDRPFRFESWEYDALFFELWEQGYEILSEGDDVLVLNRLSNAPMTATERVSLTRILERRMAAIRWWPPGSTLEY